MSTQAQPRTRRRKKLVKPRLQLRIVASFFAITATGLLLQALLFSNYLTEVAVEMPSGGQYLLGRTAELLWRSLAVSFLVLLPIVMMVGIHSTFRLSGPLYRFEQHLLGILRGEDMGQCRIREKDELQGFCELLNETLAYVREDSSSQSEESSEDSGEEASVQDNRAA